MSLFGLSAGGVLCALALLNYVNVKPLLLGWTATSLATVLTVLGMPAQASGATLVVGSYRVNMILECTAVFPTVVFVGAVMAHRVCMSCKVAGIVAGLVGIQLMNGLRLVLLVMVAREYPEALDVTHHVAFPAFMILGTVCLWLMWAVRYAHQND